MSAEEPRGPEPDPDDDDLGEAIPELQELFSPPADGFLDRVLRGIERRRTAADVGRFLWYTPVLFVIEFLDMIFTGIGGTRDEPRPGKEGKNERVDR